MIVPLGDLIESRRLVLSVDGFRAFALFGAALSTCALPFLIAAMFIGLGFVSV